MRPYRAAVIKTLEGMRIRDLSIMEDFETSAKDSKTSSLEELKASDIYVGVFGHRYGYVPESDIDEFKSITRSEYEHALKLNHDPQSSMKMLIYLAADEVGIPGHLAEETSYRDAQRRFRKQLENRHSVKYFDSEDGLREKVAIDIGNLLKNRAVVPSETNAFRLFDENDDELIKSEFDDFSIEQLQAIDYCIDFVTEQFGTLFILDKGHAHPFLQLLKAHLSKTKPGLQLNDEAGVLLRTGVRHVVLRAETFQKLVASIAVKRSLRDVGAEIGKGAASDLILKVIRKKCLLPTSADALIKLWSFWDRTGGWGSLQLIPSPADDSYEIGVLGPKEPASREPQWTLRLDNNSLEMSVADGLNVDEKSPQQIADFWCGYITGFLDTALRQMTRLYGELRIEERSKITWPIYHRVETVGHRRIQERGRDVDIFGVRFKEEPLSQALISLANMSDDLSQKNVPRSIKSAQEALRSTREVGGPAFQGTIADLPDNDRDELNRLDATARLPLWTEEKAKHYLKVLTLVIQDVALKLEPQR